MVGLYKINLAVYVSAIQIPREVLNVRDEISVRSCDSVQRTIVSSRSLASPVFLLN